MHKFILIVELLSFFHVGFVWIDELWLWHVCYKHIALLDPQEIVCCTKFVQLYIAVSFSESPVFYKGNIVESSAHRPLGHRWATSCLLLVFYWWLFSLIILDHQGCHVCRDSSSDGQSQDWSFCRGTDFGGYWCWHGWRIRRYLENAIREITFWRHNMK